MKKFWEDYKVLCEQTGEFYVEHWKGIVVLNAALVGVGIAVGYLADLKFQKDLEKMEAKYYGDEEEG